MALSYVSRKGWGAKYGIGSPDPGAEPRVVLHHSYKPFLFENSSPISEIQAVRGIEEYHVRDNGWDGIGYNWLIAPSGRIYEGRGWKYKGAHAGPVNGSSIGICIIVDGNQWEPTDRVIWANRGLIAEGIRLGEISPAYLLSGHRDHMDRECPGDKIYARLQEFRHDADRGVTIEAVIPDVKTEPKPAQPAATTLPPNLRVIAHPKAVDIDRIARVRGLSPQEIDAGKKMVEVIEVLGRAALAGREATLKELVDAAADWIKGRI